MVKPRIVIPPRDNNQENEPKRANKQQQSAERERTISQNK